MNKYVSEVRDSMFYLQDRSGASVKEGRAREICTHARSIWEHLASKNMAPKTWLKRSAPAAAYYYQEMYKFCDDLRLGEGDWKAERLAIDTYSGWTRGKSDGIRVPKLEDHDGSLSLGNKRKIGNASGSSDGAGTHLTPNIKKTKLSLSLSPANDPKLETLSSLKDIGMPASPDTSPKFPSVLTVASLTPDPSLSSVAIPIPGPVPVLVPVNNSTNGSQAAVDMTNAPSASHVAEPVCLNTSNPVPPALPATISTPAIADRESDENIESVLPTSESSFIVSTLTSSQDCVG